MFNSSFYYNPISNTGMYLPYDKLNTQRHNFVNDACEDKDGNIVMGFYAGHTHSIIPCPDDDCLLGHSDNAVILKAVKAWMEKYRVRAYDENIHKGTVRHILIRTGFHTDEIMLCLVTKKMLRKEAADGLVDVVKELNGEISGSAVGDVDIDKNIGESEDNHTPKST